MLKLFDHPLSGNCYKVRLFLHLNRIAFETEFMDVLARKNQTEAFEAISPLKQIPVLQDEDTPIWDSQAILVYLAEKYAPKWMPAPGSPDRARLMQWLIFASKEIAESLQPMRLYRRFGEAEAAHHMGLQSTPYDAQGGTTRCQTVLRILDRHLQTRSWLVGDAPSIADIACYPYVAMADEAGFDLRDYPQVQRWTVLIGRLPGYVPMVPQSLTGQGSVVGLHTAPRAMLPLKNVTELQLVAGKGVEGDRYSVGAGYLSEKIAEFGVTDQREVTLFQQETLAMLRDKHGIELAMHEHRRNITTRGIDLNSLIGKKFRIGQVLLLGFETTPCKHLEEMTGQPIAPLLVGRSGLNARIVTGGTVRIADSVEIVE